MFQIYLFHFPFSCQHFRLELKCLILLRHLHFLPSTSSVLISSSVTVPQLSVKKVLGGKKPIPFLPKGFVEGCSKAYLGLAARFLSSGAVVQQSRNLVANLSSVWLVQTSLKM